jgi:hypothetical protein
VLVTSILHWILMGLTFNKFCVIKMRILNCKTWHELLLISMLYNNINLQSRSWNSQILSGLFYGISAVLTIDYI